MQIKLRQYTCSICDLSGQIFGRSNYGDFKASSNVKFASTHYIRIKLYSILSDTSTLAYFTSIQISVHYLLIFSNSFLLKSIGSFRLSIFLKQFFLNVRRLLQFPCFKMSSICTPLYNAPVDAADLQLCVLYLLTSTRLLALLL